MAEEEKKQAMENSRKIVNLLMWKRISLRNVNSHADLSPQEDREFDFHLERYENLKKELSLN